MNGQMAKLWLLFCMYYEPLFFHGHPNVDRLVDVILGHGIITRSVYKYFYKSPRLIVNCFVIYSSGK